MAQFLAMVRPVSPPSRQPCTYRFHVGRAEPPDPEPEPQLTPMLERDARDREHGQGRGGNEGTTSPAPCHARKYPMAMASLDG